MVHKFRFQQTYLFAKQQVPNLSTFTQQPSINAPRSGSGASRDNVSPASNDHYEDPPPVNNFFFQIRRKIVICVLFLKLKHCVFR